MKNKIRPIHPGEILREEFLEPIGASPQAAPLWWAEVKYDDDDGDASWMRWSHAWRFIEASIASGRASEWAKPLPT